MFVLILRRPFGLERFLVLSFVCIPEKNLVCQHGSQATLGSISILIRSDGVSRPVDDSGHTLVVAQKRGV